MNFSKAIAALLVLVLLFGAAHAQNYTHCSWTRLLPNPSPFRKQHMGAFLGTSFVAYGGLDSALFSPTDIHTYTFDSNKFQENYTTATSGRRSCGFVRYNNQIVAYGGFLGGSRTSSTMFLDLDTFQSTERAGSSSEWTVVNPNNILVHTSSPCTDPTAVLDNGGNMWVFGGLTSVTMLNHISKFRLANSTVYAIDDNTANRPSRRYATAGAYVEIGGKPYIFMFGGLRQKLPSEEPTTLGDEILFDLQTEDWANVSTVLGSGRTLPSGRCYANMVALPNNTGVVLYGGDLRNSTSGFVPYDDAWFLDLRPSSPPYQWTRITYTSATNPAARTQAVGVLAENNGEVSFVVHGGAGAGDSTFNEVWKLNFDSCPFGPGNCFTPNPYRNDTTTGGGAGGATTGNDPGSGGAGGAGSGPDQFATGLVAVAPAATLTLGLVDLLF